MMTSKRVTKQTCALLIFLVLSSAESMAAEVKTVFDPVHWAYSSFFGTGWYQIEGARSVFVVRAPFRQVLRPSSLEESGTGKLGIEIRYPLTVGLHDIEDLGGIIENDNFASVAFAPGVELEIPITERWYLRTLAHVGWGTDIGADESAWIYYAGLKSRYVFPARKYQWSLLGGLYYAGFTPDEGRSDHLAVAQIGAELKQPLDKARFNGEPIDLHWTFMYSFLGNDLHFNLPDGRFDPIGDQIELGLQVSLRNRPFKVWFFDLQRLGVAYQFSSSGQFTAITFSMRSWFTK